LYGTAYEVLRKHKARRRIQIGPSDRGLPPTTAMIPLTPEEEAAAVAEADSWFAEQRRLIEGHYGAMYDVLLRSFPIHEAWDLK
jgi:hypothetical protein